MHFCKAIASHEWWAHRKHFTELHIASPAYPPCGRRAYGTIPHCFKRHPTWLIMILGIRAHSVRFQITVQIDKGSTDFYVLSIHGTQLLRRNAQTVNKHLSLNVLGYKYKKKVMSIRSIRKKMRNIWLWLNKMSFSRVRAPRICYLYFDFKSFVYYMLVDLFAKWFLWNLFKKKLQQAISENMLFWVFFLKMTEI